MKLICENQVTEVSKLFSQMSTRTKAELGCHNFYFTMY